MKQIKVILLPNDDKMSFKNIFEKYLLKGGSQKFLLKKDYYSYEITIYVECMESKDGKRIYKINYFVLEEKLYWEIISGRYENNYQNFAIYNFDDNRLEKDCYLKSQYNSEGDYLSNVLRDVFFKVPFVY